LLRASVVNLERLDILPDSIRHPSKKLLSLEFAQCFYFPLPASWYITGINRTSELKLLRYAFATSFRFKFRASRFITGLNRTSKPKDIVVRICTVLLFSITSVLIYYGTQSDIRVKCYCGMHLLQASVLNFEHLDILSDSIGHLSKRILSLEFAQCFCFPLPVSWYITRLNRTSDLDVIAVCICYEHPFSILSVRLNCSELLFSISRISIYYVTQSDIRVKSYCGMHLLRASIFNLERLDILRDSIGHPCIKVLSFEFATSIHFQFGACLYITGLNRTSEYNVIVVWNCTELLFSILCVSIYYRTQSDIRVKSYCHLNLLRTSVFNLESLNILRDSIGHPTKKLISFEFSMNFHFQFWVPRYITGLNRTYE